MAKVYITKEKIYNFLDDDYQKIYKVNINKYHDELNEVANYIYKKFHLREEYEEFLEYIKTHRYGWFYPIISSSFFNKLRWAGNDTFTFNPKKWNSTNNLENIIITLSPNCCKADIIACIANTIFHEIKYSKNIFDENNIILRVFPELINDEYYIQKINNIISINKLISNIHDTYNDIKNSLKALPNGKKCYEYLKNELNYNMEEFDNNNNTISGGLIKPIDPLKIDFLNDFKKKIAENENVESTTEE